MDPFRNDLEAAHRRQAELERENADLRETLERARQPRPDEPRRRWIVPALVALALLVGVASFLAFRSAPTAAVTPPAASHVDFTQPGAAPAKDPWIQVPLPARVPLYALAVGVDLTYASGAKGTILRRHGGEDVWSQEKSPTDANLYGIALQMGHVVAVGDVGTIVDLASQGGAEFRAVPSGTRETLRAVAFSYLGAVAVGDHGTLLVNTTGAWTAEKSGTTETLRAVCAGLQAIFVVGDRGTILRREGDAWVREASGTTSDLRGVVCDDRTVIVAGAGGVVLQRGDPRAGFKLQKMGEADLFSVDAYYGTSSWIAVGRGGALQRATGIAKAAGLHGDLYAVRQGPTGTYVAGEVGLFLEARGP